MRKSGYILVFVLCALFCCACASQAPLDDAYHWPEKKNFVAQPAQTATTTPAKPTLEIVSQQDTTVTMKIKR